MNNPEILKQKWLILELPACVESMLTVQSTVGEFADRKGFESAKRFQLDLALEELVSTVLRFAYEDVNDVEDAPSIRVEVRIDDEFFNVRLISRALPFNWSMIPEYDPAAQLVDAEVDGSYLDAGLSAFLLEKVVDQYRLINLGKDGVCIELVWRLLNQNIANLELPLEAFCTDKVSTDHHALSAVRRLRSGEEIQVSRLVYRSYGYTYVSDALYYPEKIEMAISAGTLDSWVVADDTGELVGHIALMKSSPDALSVEWGMAVVSPRLRGRGVMKKMVEAMVAQLPKTNAVVAFAHAVAIHPFTQKTALEFGFQPLALQLGFAPAIKFRQLDESASHRESTFICMRFFQSVSETVLYVPLWYRVWFERWLNQYAAVQVMSINWAGSSAEPEQSAMGVSFDQAVRKRQDAHRVVLAATVYVDAKSQLSTVFNAELNSANIQFQIIGEDYVILLNREIHRLSSNKVDVIYLFVNLAEENAPALISGAESLGFFVSGWMPMSPWPMTFCLQYMNHVKVDKSAITVASEEFDALKNWVFDECDLCEQLALLKFGD